LVRRRHHLHITRNVVRSNREALAYLKHDWTASEAAHTNLGALQIDKDADTAAVVIGGGTNMRICLLVDRVIPM
jgi:hypothetical protein